MMATVWWRLEPYASVFTALGISLFFLALRLPFRAEFLINWDAVNYALGTNLFSLEHHQPHPPGYIGYIALGWLLNHLTGEANVSFTLLSTISGAAAPAALFLLASHVMSWRYALVTAVTFGLSPLVWYYSQVALGYSLAMALALFFLWSGYQARANNSLRSLYVATVFLIFLGSVRQSSALFLIPLWLYLIWSFPWRHRLQAGALLVAGNLAWLTPLILLAGDPWSYIQASAELASLAVAPTSLNIFGSARNIAFVSAGILVGVNAGLAIVGLGHWSRAKPLARLTAQDRIFFLLWLAPSLATYVLIHTGQLGYVLLILPIGFLWAGLALSAMDRKVQAKHLLAKAQHRGAVMFRKPMIACLIAVFGLTNVTGSLYAPKMPYALANPEKATAAQEMAIDFFVSLPLLDVPEKNEKLVQWTRQFNIEKNDQHWNQLITFVDQFHPTTTAVLATPHGWGSFRHVTYYLPEYSVYGLGKDFDKDFGHLFTAQNRTSDYSVHGLENAENILDLPDNVTHLVIPDKEIYSRLAVNENVSFLNLKNTTKVCLVTVPRNSRLSFVQNEEEKTRVAVDSPGNTHPWLAADTH